MVPVPGVAALEKIHFKFPASRGDVPLQIESLGHNPEQEEVLRPQGYPGYHWIETASGMGEVEIGGRKVLLARGQGLFLVPGVPHRYRALGWPWSTSYLTFAGPLASDIVGSLGLRLSSWYQWDETGEFAGFLQGEIAGLRENGWGTEWSRSEVVYRFLLRCRSLCRPHDGVETTVLQERMGPLFQHIENNIWNPGFGVAEMADFLHVSARHLNDLFRKLAQTSPYQYLQDLRLAEARRLLLSEPSVGIKEIAARVGFRDPSHFILAFRKATGVSPGQFRKSPVAA
jgi:AraC family transcriptional regulator of arabinose operon